MENDKYNQILEVLQDKKVMTDELKPLVLQCEEKNGLLFTKKGKRIVRDFEVMWIFQMLHKDLTAGHVDLETTYEKARTRFMWPNMRQNLRDLISNCWECNLRKPRNKKGHGIHPIEAVDLFDRWGIDIVGPLPVTERGNKYIIVAVEYFSRWPEARPLKAANAMNVADFIYEEIICRFGAPRVIQSDRGTHFVNEVIRLLMEKFRVKHALSAPYHSQTNGLVERFNRTLCEGLAKVGNSLHDWDKFI